jgi:hypothetical protein
MRERLSHRPGAVKDFHERIQKKKGLPVGQPFKWKT